MEPFQQATAVLVVLGLLGVTLYALRVKGLPIVTRRGAAGGQRRLESIDRLPLTPQHSLHLVRVEGRTVLIAVSPGGCSMVERALEGAHPDADFPHGGLIR